VILHPDLDIFLVADIINLIHCLMNAMRVILRKSVVDMSSVFSWLKIVVISAFVRMVMNFLVP
jgi:hypothetical protein